MFFWYEFVGYLPCYRMFSSSGSTRNRLRLKPLIVKQGLVFSIKKKRVIQILDWVLIKASPISIPTVCPAAEKGLIF